MRVAAHAVSTDDQTFVKNLPHSVAAVFFLPTPCEDIYDGPKCEDYARGAHRNFLRHFRLTELELPLVKFEFTDFETPFVAMPNCDPKAKGVFSCEPGAA